MTLDEAKIEQDIVSYLKNYLGMTRLLCDIQWGLNDAYDTFQITEALKRISDPRVTKTGHESYAYR